MGERHYTIAEMAKKLDVEPHVLYYWETELRLDIPRNERGYREYRKIDLRTFRNIQCLRQKGFRMSAIKLVVNDMERILALPAEKQLQLRDKLDIAMGLNSLDSAIRFDRLEQSEEPEKAEKKEVAAPGTESIGKLEQFRTVMTEIITEAMRQNAVEISQRINYSVSESVVRELDYLLRRREDREEEHFRRLDEALGAYRAEQSEAAAASEKQTGGGLLFRKEKKLP